MWLKLENQIWLEMVEFRKICSTCMISSLMPNPSAKVSSSYQLCVECFSQLSFDSEVYTKSAAVPYCQV